jgi:hypothetical protein
LLAPHCCNGSCRYIWAMELSELAFSLILSTENVLTKKIVPYQILYTQNPHENMKSRKIFSATNGPKLAQTGPNLKLFFIAQCLRRPLRSCYKKGLMKINNVFLIPLVPQPYSNFCQGLWHGYDTYFIFLQYFQKKSSHSLSQSYAQ